ncbi:MAG: hypothetical protein U0165_05265 [Polyangiaceae bacterium]
MFKMRATPSELVLLEWKERGGDRREGERARQEQDRSLAYRSRVAGRLRAADNARLAIVSTSLEQLKTSLEQAASTLSKSDAAFSTPTGIHYATGATNPGSVAFLFPGQGSQHVGMGGDLAMTYDVARLGVDDASNVKFR